MFPLSDAVDQMRERGLRVTPQRRAILEAFRGTAEEHLSAEEVLSRAVTAVPEIGRGTVYAALAELAELGLLASVGHSEPVRYESNVAPHEHFYCRLCLRMFDVDLDGAELLTRTPEGYQPEQVIVRVEGVCAACRDYHRGLREGVRSIETKATLDETTLDGLACVIAPSTVGELGLVASEEGITRVAFAGHADFDRIAICAAHPETHGGHRRLRRLEEAIQEYLAGATTPLTDAIDWHLIAEPAAEALQNVIKIPFGQHRSYDKLCSLSPYDCGWTMGSNPIPLLIPCHRVRCGPHRLETYVGGSERLRALHRLEAAAGL